MTPNWHAPVQLLNIVNYFILDLDKFHFVEVPAFYRINPGAVDISVDGECRFLVVEAINMHRKKAGKFMFIPSVLVIVVSIVALVNTASAELNRPSSGGTFVMCILMSNLIRYL